MIKALVAFLLGLPFLLGVLSFVVFMFVGETADRFWGDTAVAIVTVIVMIAYFFICQFRLSRGNPNAFLKDWPNMLALNAALFLILFIGFFVPENLNATYAVQSLALVLACFAGTLAGAFVASRAARRKREQKVS